MGAARLQTLYMCRTTIRWKDADISFILSWSCTHTNFKACIMLMMTTSVIFIDAFPSPHIDAWLVCKIWVLGAYISTIHHRIITTFARVFSYRYIATRPHRPTYFQNVHGSMCGN